MADYMDARIRFIVEESGFFENNFLENYIPRKNGIAEEDTVEVAKELLEKYSEVYTQF